MYLVNTDVMIDIRSGTLQCKYLLDISRLSDLREIKITDTDLTIGAAATISEISSSETIGRHAPALQKAADRFASRQVRNIATIGGNVAHCSPCGDTIPPLLIHDAVAVIANTSIRGSNNAIQSATASSIPGSQSMIILRAIR